LSKLVLSWVRRSVDLYGGFGNDTLSGSAEVSNVSAFFEHEVFPRMRSHQQAMVVPGFFGCANCQATDCGSLASQEARLRDKLRAYVEYLATEPRMVGLAPWVSKANFFPIIIIAAYTTHIQTCAHCIYSNPVCKCMLTCVGAVD
jgi:hypothetical protein